MEDAREVVERKTTMKINVQKATEDKYDQALKVRWIRGYEAVRGQSSGI